MRVEHGLPLQDDLRQELMDDLHYEDDQGLWEVVWLLNTKAPEVTRDEKIALARAVIFGLLDEGRIELRQVTWPEHDGRLLNEVEVARLHHDDAPWFDPEATDLLVQVSERE